MYTSLCSLGSQWQGHRHLMNCHIGFFYDMTPNKWRKGRSQSHGDNPRSTQVPMLTGPPLRAHDPAFDHNTCKIEMVQTMLVNDRIIMLKSWCDGLGKCVHDSATETSLRTCAYIQQLLNLGCGRAFLEYVYIALGQYKIKVFYTYLFLSLDKYSKSHL
jgi:hypothetical protein